MIYILFACFCVFFAFSLYRTRKVHKHDGVLFPFCELRRDIMRFLYRNMDTLSRDEYRSLRFLLGALDTAIHDYNQHKTLMFNLRKMAKHLKEYRKTVKEADIPEWTGKAEIQAFHARFVRCLATAFLTYTPLIRSEFALRLIALAYRAGSRQLQYVLENAGRVRADAKRGDGDLSYA